MIDVENIICEEDDLEKERVWTILKTPVVRRDPSHSSVTFMLACDGRSDVYAFYGIRPITVVDVVVNNNGTIMLPTEYKVLITGTEGKIMFHTPPAAGTIISVYF